MNQESKETFDFDQGTRKYGHIKFSQSIGLPPRNSYLVAIQELAARACLLVFCKLLQTFLQTQSLPSRNSQPCVFRRLYKIQCIPKLPEPWFKFKNFETKAMRRSCTSSRCIWFSRSPFPGQGSAVTSKKSGGGRGRKMKSELAGGVRPPRREGGENSNNRQVGIQAVVPQHFRAF